MEKTYRKGFNIGVRLGEPSLTEDGYLYLIDFDIRVSNRADEAWAKLKELFPDINFDRLPCVQSGSGGKSLHFYIISDGLFSSKRVAHSEEYFIGDDGKKHYDWEIEILGTGKQAVVPPSIHPITDKPYKWVREFDLDGKIPFVDGEVIAEVTGQRRLSDDRSEREYNPVGVVVDDMADMLGELDADRWCEDRDFWIRLGMAIHYDTEGSQEGFKLWEKYSKTSDRYNAKHIRSDWKSFSVTPRSDPFTFRSIIQEINEKNDRLLYARLPEMFEDIEDDERASMEGDGVRADPPCKGLQNEFEDIDYDDGQPFAPGVPRKVQRMPGVLGQFAKWMNRTSMQPQPQLAMQAALALGCAVLGRNYTTQYRNFASLYLVNIVETSSGKEQINTALQHALGAANKMHLIGSGDFTSDSALEGDLEINGRFLSVLDEVAHTIGAIKSVNGGVKATVEGSLLKLFTSTDKAYYPKAMSNMNKTIEQRREMQRRMIMRPAFSFIGMTTPDKFNEAISNADVGTGLVNRMLIAKSTLVLQYKTYHEEIPPIPRSIVRWIEDYANDDTDDDDMMSEKVKQDTRIAPEPKMIRFTRAAVARIREVDRKVTDKQREILDTGLHGLFGRTTELAMRVALIIALGCRSKTIEVEHFDWAYSYVIYNQDVTFDLFLNDVGKGKFARISERLAEIIRGAGKKGIIHAKLLERCVEYERLETNSERKEVMERLKSHHGIFPHENKGKRGPKGLRFYAPGFAPED